MLTDEQIFDIRQWVMGLIEFGKVHGRRLTETERPIAGQAGVHRVDEVVVLEVEQMPSPPDNLRALAEQFLNPEDAAGLTLGHLILIRQGYMSERLLRHELRHVQQSEILGSWENFLGLYLTQVLQHGYDRAPLELDAREYG